MLIDIITLSLLVLAVFKGLRNGLIVGIFSFLAFIIGLAAAMKLSTVAATYIGDTVNVSQRWLPFLAFAVVFIAVVFVVRLGAKALEGIIRIAMLDWLNRLGGVALYILIYLFLFSILLFYAEQVQLIKPEAIQTSVTYGYIHSIAPKMINALGYILPFFKNMFAELEAFFGKLSSRAS